MRKLGALVLFVSIITSCHNRENRVVIKCASNNAYKIILPNGTVQSLPLEFTKEKWNNVVSSEEWANSDHSTWFPVLQRGGRKILCYTEDENSVVMLKLGDNEGLACVQEIESQPNGDIFISVKIDNLLEQKNRTSNRTN